MRSRALIGAVVIAAIGSVACKGDDAMEVIGAGGALPCAPGQSLLEDGRCLDAGMQADGCRAGEFLGDDGTCLPAGTQPDGCPAGTYADESGCRDAGVPPELCAEGFAPDGNHGCVAILPARSCPIGTMAVPGESECHELAPCGSGTFGSIPALAGTQYVDASYNANDADGSMGKPWPTIQQAVDAASSSAVIAIAAGSYVEDVRIADKSVELWGRCPALVELVATGTEQAAIRVAEGADGTWIRSLAVTGPAIGIVVAGSVDVHAENVWVHDTASMGIASSNQFGITQLTLDGVLVEAVQDLYGLYLAGVEALVVDSVVRDTQRVTPLTGWGFAIQVNDGIRADVTVRRSLIERNIIAGGKVQGADLVIEGSVARDNVFADMVGGSGLLAADADGQRGNLVARGCVIEHNEWTGISVLSSDATVEGVVIRDTAPAFTSQGRGLRIEDGPERSKVDVRSSLFEANNEMGMIVVGSDVTMEGTRIVDTLTAPVESYSGMGVLLSSNPSTAERATALLRSSYIGGSKTAGLLTIGTDATVHGVAIEDTRVSAIDATVGDGAGFYADSHAVVQHSRIERSEASGVSVAAGHLEMDATAVLDTRATMENGEFGTGVLVRDDVETGVRSSAIIRRSRVERSQFSGINVVDADGTIESTLVTAVRDNLAYPEMAAGVFVATFTAVPATAQLRGCVLEETGALGLVVYGGEATVDATVIRESTAFPGSYEVRCVHAQQAILEDGLLGFCGKLSMKDSRVEGCDSMGIAVGSAEASISNTVVRDARALDGIAGDGVVVYAIAVPGACAAQLAVEGCYVGNNARAGITNFGMSARVGTTTFECNAMDIHGQDEDTAFSFVDLGGNQCGCGRADETCRVVGATLDPPGALESP